MWLWLCQCGSPWLGLQPQLRLSCGFDCGCSCSYSLGSACSLGVGWGDTPDDCNLGGGGLKYHPPPKKNRTNTWFRNVDDY